MGPRDIENGVCVLSRRDTGEKTVVNLTELATVIPALLKEIHDYDMLEQVYGYQYTGLLNEPGKNDKHLGGPATEVLYEEFYKYQLERRGLSE